MCSSRHPAAHSKVPLAALHADGVAVRVPGDCGPNEGSRSALPGEIVEVFGSGFGDTNPGGEPGWIDTSAAPLTALGEPTVAIGGLSAEIVYAGLTGAGLNQVNLRIPALPAGRHPVRVPMRGIAGSFWGEMLVGAL